MGRGSVPGLADWVLSCQGGWAHKPKGKWGVAMLLAHPDLQIWYWAWGSFWDVGDRTGVGSTQGL